MSAESEAKQKRYLAARYLLRELSRAGVRVRVVDGQARAAPAHRVTPEIAAQLARYREDLLAVLTARTAARAG